MTICRKFEFVESDKLSPRNSLGVSFSKVVERSTLDQEVMGMDPNILFIASLTIACEGAQCRGSIRASHSVAQCSNVGSAYFSRPTGTVSRQ